MCHLVTGVKGEGDTLRSELIETLMAYITENRNLVFLISKGVFRHAK